MEKSIALFGTIFLSKSEATYFSTSLDSGGAYDPTLQAVEICGLTNATALNGQRGVVTSYAGNAAQSILIDVKAKEARQYGIGQFCHCFGARAQSSVSRRNDAKFLT